MLSDRFAGNHECIGRLEKQIESGRLPHAIALCGESGTGKSTLAVLLAAAACCRGEGRPCFECAACRKVLSGSHPDVEIRDAEAGPDAFVKKSVSGFKNDIYILANEAGLKVRIIENAGSLGTETVNAILKVIEEPPQPVLYIATAASPGQLLPTLRSRFVCCSLRAPEPEEAAERIAELAGCGRAQALETARRFGGNIGRSAAYLTDPSVRKLYDAAAGIIGAAAEYDAYGLSRMLLDTGDDKRERQRLLETLRGQLGTLLRGPAAPGVSVSERAAERISGERALRMTEALSDGLELLESNCPGESVMMLTALALSE